MKIIDQVTSPGGQRPNEDRLGYAGPLAWVLDGATDLESDAFLPAGSDVQWLVDRVGELLTELGRRGVGGGAEDLLRSLSARIGDEIASLGFPPGRIHPTCSIGLLVARDDHWELARIGDPTCLAVGARTVELSTGFFGRREAQALDRARSGGLDQETNRRGIIERRAQYIEGCLEESVFSGHPNAHLRIQSTVVDPHGVEYVLLCTDGFSRAVVDYGLYPDWNALGCDALVTGLTAVVERLRQYEEEQAGSNVPGVSRHFKKSDDATALLIRG
jgi:hypothetical protein